MKAPVRKGRKVTEKFTVARCGNCGGRVGFEDGVKQDFCLCDPWCECCGRQFVAARAGARATSPGRSGARICDECIEEEIIEMFSEEFLKALSAAQMAALIRDISRRLE